MFILHYSLFINPSASAQDLQQQEVPEPVAVRALPPRFENLSLKDGLSQTSINDMFQDRTGFIWIATQDGLNRYDGYSVKVYNAQPFDSTTLSASWVLGITEDKAGSLWVGTLGGGLNRMDPITERFHQFRHDPDDPTSVGSGNVSDVLEDKDGILWVATGAGLDRMDDDRDGRFTHYVHDPSDPNSLSSNRVFNLFEDQSGGIWISTEDGLNKMDEAKSGRFTRYLVGEDWNAPAWKRLTLGRSVPNEVYGIVERPEEPGILWIGTIRGLVRLDTRSGATEHFVLNPDNARSNTVYQPGQDPLNPGLLWIPVYGTGLARFDVRSRAFIMYESHAGDPNSLVQNTTSVVLADRSQVVWVGTQTGGVDRFNPASVGFSHIRYDSNDPKALPGAVVWGICQTRDGMLWVSTSDLSGNPRLSRIDRTTGAIKNYAHVPSDPTSIDRGASMSIYEDRTGTLWLGTRGSLDRLDRSTGRFSHYRHDPFDPQSLSEGRPNAILMDRAGNLWVGTSEGGVNRMRFSSPGRFDHFAHDSDDPTTITHNRIHVLYEDLAGFIWVGTVNGISRLDPETGATTRYEHDPDDPTTLSAPDIHTIVERSREPGVIWLGMHGGGLNRLEVATGEITHFTEKDGLSNNLIYGLMEDGEGRLWMSNNQGISRFDPETKTFRNYGLEIGLQSLEFNQWSYHKGPTGELFFGGVNGLNAFYPNELSENLKAPEVRIVDLKLFNESIRSSGAVPIDRPIPQMEVVRLSYDQKDVTFDFAAFHFANSEKNRFAYKLEGYDDDWVDAGSSRSAFFTNLAPGDYTFRVKAANSDGIWNEEGAAIRLVITPPFWATWWFRILAFAGFVGLIYGGIRWRVEQVAARARQLEGEVATRTAELRASNEQLEQSHTIVEAINQETSLSRLLTKILEQARVIRGVEKGTALTISTDEGVFRVRASSGWDIDKMRAITLTKAEAQARYVDRAEEVAEDIFVTKDIRGRAGSEHMAEFGEVASFLVLRVRIEDETVAYLVFDNLTDEDAFDQRDVDLLERLREHIVSAFIKTRILEDLNTERANLQTAFDNLRNTQDRLIQSEKMASLGQLTAGIAHEIKNPLNFVNNFSDVTAELAEEAIEEIQGLRTGFREEGLDDLEHIIKNLTTNVRKIAEHGKRADGIVKNMLEHSKVGEGERQPTDLNELLAEYVTLARHGFEARGDDFEVRYQQDFDASVGKLDVVPQDLGRVFMNLIGNAFDALKEHGAPGGESTITVSTARAGNHVEVRVSDNGPGIPEKVKARIFEPFFTTKPTGSGTGLGLSMSYDIVTKGHGGSLDVVSEEGKGATFVVRLPI